LCIRNHFTSIHRPFLHSFTFNQRPSARASGPLAPGHQADSRRPRRSPLQFVSAAARSARPGYSALNTPYVAAAATSVATFVLISNSRRCQPVPRLHPPPRPARVSPRPPPVARAPDIPPSVRPTSPPPLPWLH
jgi:hypothetical protein